MKKFKFTLQTVHSVREMRQEKEELVFSQMQSEANAAAERIAHIEKMRFEAIEKYTQKLKAGEFVCAKELEMNSNHFASLDRLQREAEKVLEDKKRACDAQSRKLAAAVREVKITNRLRETQAVRHKLELDRQEQTNLDEIVSANFARRLIGA